ncbi:hypothetical protein AAVH_13503 [Aphelenchoides avenae]|nr:hypothetical protein AAVH_13503 [Aphelenchus avenae]
MANDSNDQALYDQWMLDGEHETTACLKEGSGIPNGLYELTKAREAAEAHELAGILAEFETEAPDEDDT